MSLRNSEILLLYEVKLANPNGDPDDENRPRMDPKTRRVLVTDVRLKRFFRDYVISTYGEEFIWVSKQNGQHVSADTRFRAFGNDLNRLLKSAIDARLFGVVVTKKGEGGEGKGESYPFTGPLQFSWGYSLHRVDMVDTRSITSVFSGAKEGEGNIGKDYRVYYALIAFYGAFNSYRAKETGCSENDLKIFDNFIWEALKTESVTRSKIGHYPHLYLRVELGEGESYIGDLRRFISVEQKENVRDLQDLTVDLSKLIEVVKDHRVYLRCSDEFKWACEDPRLTNKMPLPHSSVDLKIFSPSGVKS
ncbi:MAG: type I-B CRISPR-associated protein Cas7/Csh2 [Nitrososphaeria archaeon]